MSLSTLLSMIQSTWLRLVRTAKNVWNFNEVPSRLEASISITVMVAVLVLITASAGNVVNFRPLDLLCVCLSISAAVLVPIIIRSIGRSIPELYQYVKNLGSHSTSQGPMQKVNPRVSHNMLNTIFVATMIAFILPLLYMFLWGRALNETVIETSLARYVRRTVRMLFDTLTSTRTS
jgi:hypothetical protein